MIKAVATGKAGMSLIIGLTQANWDLMKAGRPIMVNGPDLGLSVASVILMGEDTDEELLENLRVLGLVK